MKHFTQILGIAFLMLIAAAMPAVAQNESQNKAIITTAEGEQQLNTDEISVIRFDGGKVTVEQPWGNTTYDGTLRSLSFQRPNPGTLRLTANAGIGADYGTGNVRRLGANAITGGKLKTTWESGDKVYVYADESSESSIGELTPKTFGSNSAQLTGDINAAGLSSGQMLYFSTMPRPINLSAQDGTVESLFYCTATATVSINGGNASIENLAFARPVAIVRFVLQDKSSFNALKAMELTISADGYDYKVTPASPTEELFVALRKFSGQTVSLSATTVSSDTYTYEKTGVTFDEGKYYTILVRMSEPAAACKELSAVTGSEKGWRIGSDGKAYSPTGSLPTGVSAVAMIAYVGDNTGHGIYRNGLAIAMSDEGDWPGKNWGDANSACEYKTPAVSGAAWMLPSMSQWDTMFGANEGHLNSALATAGGSELEDGSCYWTSSDDGPETHWIVNGDNDGWFTNSDDGENCVRACLAF